MNDIKTDFEKVRFGCCGSHIKETGAKGNGKSAAVFEHHSEEDKCFQIKTNC